MKPANYLPLQSNHYSNPISLNIRRIYGMDGYAIYLILLQKLASIPSRRLRLESVSEMAYDLHIENNESKLLNIIESYFKVEGQEFYSQELNDSLSWFDNKYNKLSEAGKKAAANMTPEQLKERSRIANEAKKRKAECEGNPVMGDINQQNTSDIGIDSISKNECKGNVLTTLGDIPNNKIEMNEKKEKGIIKDGNEKGNESKQNEDFSFSRSEVQKMIDGYFLTDSKFFYNNHKNIVGNAYADFFNTYPNSTFDIWKFERLLFYSLQSITMNVDAKSLNDYLTNNSISINPSNVMNIDKLISEKEEVKRVYDEIINDTLSK
jgi:hypothetical protein